MSTTDINTTKAVIGPLRLCFVHLFKPHAFEGQTEEKYSCMILIPKDDKKTLSQIKRIQEAAITVGVKTKWGGKKPAQLKTTLRDGDTEPPTDGEEFEGHYFMNLSCKTAPGIVDGNRQKILDSTEVYSGCYCNVSVNAFPYKAMGNVGVSVGLNHVQKVRDGDPLGGRGRAEVDFDAIDDGSDEGAYDDLLGL
ncbi:MAG: DUF2815 family protein [Gordonibacter sp.]